MPTETREWWLNLYDDLLAEMLLVRTDREELDATVGFIVGKLGLKRGDRVFDQCCGIGSVAIELAAAGYDVIGVERASAYVERGRAEAKERGLERIELVADDARTFVPKERARGAFNWWTSFGYSPSDEDNARMLARAFDALEPGGVFLLDTMNLPGVLRAFEAETVTKRVTPRGEVTLTRRSRIDARTGVMRKRWSYDLPSGERVDKEESVVRLYMPHSLVEMLERVGFDNIELFGDVHGRELTLDSQRCICRGEKKKQ